MKEGSKYCTSSVTKRVSAAAHWSGLSDLRSDTKTDLRTFHHCPNCSGENTFSFTLTCHRFSSTYTRQCFTFLLSLQQMKRTFESTASVLWSCFWSSWSIRTFSNFWSMSSNIFLKTTGTWMCYRFIWFIYGPTITYYLIRMVQWLGVVFVIHSMGPGSTLSMEEAQ